MHGTGKTKVTSNFALEALEPRVLLSGDTPFAEVYRTLVKDDKGGQNAGSDVYVQQLDAETSAEIAAATGSDFSSASSQSGVNVDWSAGWQVAASADSQTAQDTSAILESAPVAASAETKIGAQAAVLEQAARIASVPNSQVADDTLSADSSDQDVLLNNIPSSELPRGPPVDGQPAAVVTAAVSIQINDLGLSNSSETDEGEAFGVQFLVISEVLEDGLARGPPATDALSNEALAPVLQEAIRLWTATGLSPELAARLASIQVQVTDLPNGQLGQADQNSITLDVTAAGRGWFVDQTPADNAEFSTSLSSHQVVARAGSPAYGRLDLLTVLVHEVGHVLGFDHDAGLAVMSGNLDPGMRVLLDGSASTLIAGLGASVSAASSTAPTLDLSGAANNAATITIHVNADGTLTIGGTGTGDDLEGLAGITNIVGNANAIITLIGPDADAVWTLGPGSSGSLAFGSGLTQKSISFSFVQNISGGSGNDRLVIAHGTTSLIHFDGRSGFDAVVNRADAFDASALNKSTFAGVENFIDRPLLFIPGFGGTFIDTSLPIVDGRDALTQWYLTRGIDPTKLLLEPLGNTYSDLVQTLVNTGYTDGTNHAGVNGTLYVSLWDYRVPVAVSSDGAQDSVLTDVTAASITDWAVDSFDSGVDYFAYWMNKAAVAWQAMTGTAASGVDVITHSTGGLVARSYLQSYAYAHDVAGDNLLPVYSLIQTGVPNQGSGSIFGFLNNDFGLNSAARGLASLINNAYQLIKGGASITNPDGTSITYNAATTTELAFAKQYVSTLENLEAVYPFLDAIEDNAAVYTSLDAASGGNRLVLDLNGTSATGFVAKTERAYVVYSAAVATPDLAIKHTGVVPSLGAQNEILPFSNVIGHLPGAAEAWYEFNKATIVGDGTVSAGSASNGFSGLVNPNSGGNVLFELTQAAAGSAVVHTEITHNAYSQSQILRLLGVGGYASAKISTDLLLNSKESALNVIAKGVIDPIAVAQQAFSDTKALLADIQSRFTTAMNQTLPLIGKSLNQLLLDSGFDLFGKFASATAPVASAISKLGTFDQRLAQLEEVLEDALGFADVGGDTNYDNPQIELVYHAADARLDIVFDFNGADAATFGLSDFGLSDLSSLSLGLAFTVSIDFGDLIAKAAGGSGGSGVELSLALTGNVVINTPEFGLTGVGSLAVNLLEMLGGTVPSASFSVTGALQVGSAIQLAGTFGFEHRTGQSLMLANGTTATALSNVAYNLISGEGVSGFFGNGPYTSAVATPDATGLLISDVDFSLLLLKQGLVSYTAFTTSGGSASLIGVPDLAVGASDIKVVYNSTNDTVTPNKVLDFNDGASDSVAGIAVTPLVGPALRVEGEQGRVLRASADFALDAFGFVVLAGHFSMVKQTGLLIDDGAGPVANFTADVLSLSLTASGFVGSGARLSQQPLTDPSSVTVVTTGAVGFNVPTATLDLVILRDVATPANKYTGLQLAVTNAGLIGIDQLGLTASGTVQVNKGSAAGRLNWAEVTGPGVDKELPGVTFGMNDTVEFAIRDGSVALDAFGFVQIAGSFNLVKQTNVAIDDGVASPVAAFNGDVLSLSITTASIFAGVGGSLTAQNTSSTTVAVGAGAIGFSVPGASIGLVLVKDRAVPANKYTGLQVSVTNAALVGIDGLGLTVSATVQVNKGPAAGRLDWSQVTGANKEVPNVTLGMNQTVELAIRSGSVAVDAFGFVQLGGTSQLPSTFNLVKQTNLRIDDGAASPVAAFNADVLTVSITTASVFAGSGGTLSVPSSSLSAVVAGEIGFYVPSASLDLVLIKDRANTNKYTGLQVALTNASLVGITDLFLTVSGQVQVNKGPEAGRLDWTQVTGTGKELPGVTLPMDHTVDLAIRNGSVALDAFGFVQLAGTFSLVKQTNLVINDTHLTQFNADVLSLSITAIGFAGGGGTLSVPNNSLASVTAGDLGVNVPSASVDLVLVKDRADATKKYTGLQVTLTNAGLVGVDAQLELTVSGKVQVNKGPAAAARLDWTQVTGSGSGKELPDITLTMNESTELAIGGSIALNAFGFVQLAGKFNLVKQTNVAIGDTLLSFNADVLRLSITEASGFAGGGGSLSVANSSSATVVPGDLGVSVPSASVDLVILKDRANATNKYTGLQVTLTNAGLVGIDDQLALTVSGKVQVNKGPAAGRLDWTEVTGSGKEFPDITLTMNRTTDLAISGSIALNAFGFVALTGSFSLVKQTNISLDDGTGAVATFNADVLSLSITGATGFAGVGGSLSALNSASATVVTTDAVGLSVSGSVGLVLVTDRADATKKYTGLQIGVANATLVGMPSGFGLTVTGSVQVNKGPAAGPRLNWLEVTGPTKEITNVSLTMDHTQELAASGTLWVDVFGFVQVKGSFALAKYSTTVTLAGQTSATPVDVLAFGMDHVNVFAGAGPYFNADGSLHTDSDKAIGLLLKDTSLALALFTRTDGTVGKYHAVRAFAQAIDLLGIESDPSDTFSLTASGYRIEVNGGKTGTADAAINFAAGVGATHGDFVVKTGPLEAQTQTFAFSTKLERVAVENARLTIADYVYVSGGFSFTRQTNMVVKLSGSGTDTVNALAFGAGNVDMFVGSGPYFQDGTEVRNLDAVGLALENVNFGLLLMKSTTTTPKPINKYTTLMATADRVALVGLDNLTLSAGGVKVDYNSSSRTDKKVIDFGGTGDAYSLDTGNGALVINYRTAVLRASVEDAQLQIESYVFITGGLAFERGPSRTVTLSGATPTFATVTSIDIGAQDLTMFFGSEGPYWTDLDGDGAISWTDAAGKTLTKDQAHSVDNVVDVGETAELNPNAIGFAITNADLAMTLLKPTTGANTTKYLGLHATADQIGFVGIDAFQLSTSTIALDLNLAVGGGATSTTPVVNFASTYASERQALFNLLAGSDSSISPTELTDAIGSAHGVTTPLTTVEQLMMLLDIAGAPPADGILTMAEVTNRLTDAYKTTSSGGQTNLQRVQALDVDGDGKFDPIGKEIKTGAGSLYLAADSRQIHASADNVLLNVAEFLNVKGSVALDIGSRETVTISTGIPASLGVQASSAVVLVNDALAALEGGLTSLKTSINGAINGALASVQTKINTLLEGVIDNIVDYLKAQLALTAGSLSELSQAQISAVTTTVNQLVTTTLNSVLSALSVNQLIDNLINPIKTPIINAVPDLLKGPVGGLIDTLLSPIREKVSAEFAGLDEALTGAFSRITGSVSEAIDAAVQAAAATASATIDAARTRIETAIHVVLDPQFVRAGAELGKLLNRATAKLVPLFDRLHALTDIKIGDNFSTMTKVEVEVTALGISNASAFVGLPPSGGFDFSKPFAGQLGNAVGLSIDGLNLALGIFKPVLGKELPTFTALKLHADDAVFSDGGNDVLELIAKDIDVELNLGGPIVKAAGALFGNATIDFVASFPEIKLPVVNAKPVGYAVHTSTTGAPIYIDFKGGEIIRASVAHAELHISEFVHITGSLAFEKGTIKTVDVTGGLTGPALAAALSGLKVTVPGNVTGLPWAGAKTAELSFMTIGASNVHAFVGIDGPYWTDLDSSNSVGWAFNTGTGNAASRTVNKAVTIDINGTPTLFAANAVLPEKVVVTLSASDGDVQIGNRHYGDIDGDKLVDVNETAELSGNAKGLWIERFDFGMAIMRPTNPLDFVKYFALKATANDISVVGIEGVKVTAKDLLVELNQSTPSVYGLPLFPVVDFAKTYQSERQALFELLAGSDHIISVVESTAALISGSSVEITTVDQLMKLLDITGGTSDGILIMAEVTEKLTPAFKAATSGSPSLTNLLRIQALDADSDGKFDPAGYEVNTGSKPVYLDMGSSLIRAQGFLTLNLFDTVYLTGSVAFELGPTKEVTLSDSVPSKKTVTTMTIGAADVTAFIGTGGPYWTDLDGNHKVTRDPLVAGNGDSRIDANESLELKDNAVGFEITDLDIGILVMASIDPTDLGVYLAAKLNVESFGLVGIAGLTATGSFDVALNVGVGATGITPNVAVVNFTSSFSEAPALFDLLDSITDDGVIDQAEQVAALASGYSGKAITTAAQLVALLNTSNGPPDDYLTMVEVKAKLADSFKTSHLAAINALDVDGNTRLNTGFEVNTGNPAAPVVLDFEDFQISIQLGGEIELDNVFRLYGVFIFEVDSSSLKAFVAAGLEIGPDMGDSSKIFNMNALGALVINSAGVAADLNISVSIGGALSDFLQLNATARLVFNTTGVNQSVTIPAKYVDYLRAGGGSIPSPEAFDSSLVSGLKLTQTQLNSRLTVNPNGSATYNISGTAPGTTTAGFYLLATFNADLIILRTFTIHADFRLLLTAERFDLGYTGTLALGGFGTFNLTGGAVIDSRGFAAFGSLNVNINLAGLVTVTGGADLMINTATSGLATTVNGHDILPNTYKVGVNATIGLFGVISASANVDIGLENGIFEIAVNKLNINLYVLNLDISGYIRSNGQFNLTGSLSLPAALSSGEWGITGGISLTISNSGFSGHGSVGIKVFGQSFNIASADISVTANPYSVFIRAEGPLGVYIEITLDNVGSGIHFSGGLGFLDEIIGAIGEVATAVGQAIADAAVIVGAAFEDLGEAILDLGAAIGDALVGFVDDVGALISDIAGAIAEFFSSSRTIVITYPPTPIYSYSWSQTGGALIIDMKGGALTGVESPLSLAVVNNRLIVDGPNQTANVKVAERQRQTRSWDWGAASWGSWHNSGGAYGAVYADIEYSNMKAFDGVTSIEIRGTEGSDTIVMDAASISLPAHVYGYAGDDNIFTGNGNDYVEGGTGKDLIYTYGGADELHGGDGDDNLSGGTGNDALYGDAGNDLLNENVDRGNNPRSLLSETNLMNGGTGDDNILGSPGIDTIVGGSGNDKLTGLSNDDIYVFNNEYGTDTFADYFGKAYLDFSAVTTSLAVSISDTGLTVNAGTGHVFSVAAFISIQQSVTNGVAKFTDFQIAEIKTGQANDTVAFTALPFYRIDIVDAGGVDLYDFDLSQADVAQAVARVDIVDNGGAEDQIDLDVNSTGFNIYLHLQSDLAAQAVLLNHFELTFNFDEQVEVLNLTDHAAATTVTTAGTSGLKTLLVKDDVTITSATGGSIELKAKDDFLMEVGALIQTLGAVVIRGDDEDVDSTGATINLFGLIKANTVTVYGNVNNDTVNVTNVFPDAETTIYAGAGNDTINVGSLVPAAGGDLDAIDALLTIYGEGDSDSVNLDEAGDTDANTGALTSTTITGLEMGGSIAYGTIETLNIGLGSAGDVFTIQSTHTGVTNLNTSDGDDVVNVQTIAGITNVNGGIGSEAFNVGSNAQGAQGNAAIRGNNAGGTVDGIGALLTLNGNDPTSGSDVLVVDDTGDTNPNTGTLTATSITGLDMVGSITYGTVEHLTISLGSGGNTFTINSTHGAATSGFQEDTTVNSGSGADIVHITDATDFLVVNGQAGNDIVNVNGTGADSVVTLNTGTEADTVNINGVTNVLNVNGQADADTVNVNGTGTSSVVTLNAGAGTDTVNINGVSNLLYVNGEADADTVNVNGTAATSVATLNGDAGNDTINVRAMNGTVNVNGGDDADTINVGSDAPILPGIPTDLQGTIDAINGLLTVNGGDGGDTMNVDDSDPLVTSKSGALTYNALSGLALEHDIGYSQLETLNIWLATGDNSFTISSTHTGATTLSTALGNDTVNVDGASGTLTINAEAGNDVINVRATGAASQTNINGQGGNDTINLSDHSALLPDAYPAVQNPPAADKEGNIDAINGLTNIDGGADVDVINIDDSRNVANKAGTLGATTLHGLEMEAGVNYVNAEDFNLWLGTGTDGLYIDSTHAGTTDVFMGDGNATVNQRDDTVAIRSIGGITTVHGQRGNDAFYANVQALSANQASFFTDFKAAAAAAANDSLFNTLFTRTHVNGLGAVLNLHGDGDSDLYTLNLAGQGQALVNVHDNGASDNGVDTLVINGADVVGGLGNQPNDTFLLRRTFVALLNDSDANSTLDKAERVNYDENINARLIVNGLGGDDKFVADDNSSITTLDGGDGNDTFQIGQVFGTLRLAAAGVAAGDEFNTTPVIIGVITDPDPAHKVNGVAPVIFDPTSFDPVTQVLPTATIDAINAAILYQRNLGLALNGVAYVSSGVTHATTIFGGNGQDTFNVYHNKGTLRLEGEDGNDTFIVRAFVTIDLTKQGDTEVNGGAGADTINYAINAPVSIDGGAGFDRVVVLGTPFNDSFVVSSEGIFGAGLNVKFVNIESAELDTLEGNDTIYILGTGDDIVTTVIGGLGNDTINVIGDVMKPIVSDDQLGRSGVIAQGLSSNDADYNLVGVNGVAVNVISAGGGSLVNITPSREPLRVTEDGSLASYLISLVAPDAASLGSKPIYLTVSAGTASTTDRNIAGGGAGVLVRVKGSGGAFTNAVVLTFNSATAAGVFEIEVQAVNDGAAEGPRTALISHSINSANSAYDNLALIDVFVNVVDNDQAGLDIRQLSVDGDSYGNNTTQVLENGFGDIYSVALTAAPASGEIVTVSLVTDGQITAKSAGNLAFLTFNQANWATPQTVTVTAVNDNVLDGTEVSRITHVVTSTGAVYGSFPTTSSSRLNVTVYDDETAGAIVQQTGGSTIVAEGGATDSYRVRLTGLPDSNVTLTLRTDTQTRLGGSGVVAVDEAGLSGYFEYAYTFTTGNWSQWADITVSANPQFSGPNNKLKAFATQDQNLDQIRGPLIIEGGVGTGVSRALELPVMLPGETNGISLSQLGNTSSIQAQESSDIDALNVYHTDNSDADTGRLFYRTADSGNHAIANTGLALSGFDMGGDLVVDQGVTGAPNLVYYGGGITYNGFETVEVLLGKGNETLTVDDTGDRDEKNVLVTVDHAAITAIHGGGGDDTITINDRGEGPLVVYGDTSVDGARYSNNRPAASIDGTSFANAGNDTINASAMLDQGDSFVGVVIYGGAGVDSITGSQDDDHLAGGSGADTLRGEASNDNIYGDSHFTVNLLLFAQDQVNRFSTATQLASIAAMFTVVTDGSGAGDTLDGGSGNDVIFGDHGVGGQVDGTRRLESTGNMIRLETANIATGAADLIHGNQGNDFIFGGVAGDTIYGDLGSDLIFGDHGSVVGSAAINVNADNIGLIDGAGVTNANAKFIYTSDISGAADGSAGNDTIYGGSLAVLDTDTGKNILLGQQGSDTIYGGGGDDNIYGGHDVANGTDTGDFIDGAAGNDVILGDNGLIERTAAATDQRFAVLQGQLLYGADGLALISAGVNGANPSGVEARRIQLFDHDDSANNANNFGDDIIAGGADDDVIFGELGNDGIHADGRFLAGTGLITLTATITNADVGGDDYVEGNGGADWIYGGLGQDDLIGGSSELYGLSNPGDPANSWKLRPDGADTIFGGNGDKTARNTDGDGSHARDSDMILGDNGNIFRIVGRGGVVNGVPTFSYDNPAYAGYDALNKIVVRAAQLLDYTLGGPDLVPSSLTSDRGAADTLHGESGDDFVYGMTGSDVLFGEGQDDDLIGGWGNDWISGGTGQDGVLGDDGRLYTSRNGAAESLYGIVATTASRISTPGNGLVADINVAGQLKKTADLTPYDVVGAGQPVGFIPKFADDIIYGGLGSDFLHGGSGDDAISGAEALANFYAAPTNSGNALDFNRVTGEFAKYDQNAPLKQIANFFLNFDASEGTVAIGTAVPSDGDDEIFGDLGNDWLVGGTGKDHMYGGWGNDLLNADDDQGTNGGLNDAPDTQSSYADIAFGGAGRDRLIANTADDRLVDWAGEFNSYLVPFKAFGVGTVSRAMSPAMPEFFYALSKADGADQTLGTDATRNGEPFGELGLVKQGDAGFGTQTGGPDDPQPGSGGGKK